MSWDKLPEMSDEVKALNADILSGEPEERTEAQKEMMRAKRQAQVDALKQAAEDVIKESLNKEWFTLPFPAKEYIFDENGRQWRFDYAWPFVKIAIEINGGTWNYGRHNRASSIEGDYEKLNAAAMQGWMVLQFTADMVRDGRMLQTLLALGWE